MVRSYIVVLRLRAHALKKHFQVVEESLLKNVSGGSKKASWACLAMRPWFCAHYGVALTLRKLRRYDEALVEWERLLKMDDAWHGSSMSFINTLALYPECIYR